MLTYLFIQKLSVKASARMPKRVQSPTRQELQATSLWVMTRRKPGCLVHTSSHHSTLHHSTNSRISTDFCTNVESTWFESTTIHIRRRADSKFVEKHLLILVSTQRPHQGHIVSLSHPELNEHEPTRIKIYCITSSNGLTTEIGLIIFKKAPARNFTI